jgi:hypothetical protein
MEKKILGILFFTLLIAFTPWVAAQSYNITQQSEPLPIKKLREIPVPWQFWQKDGEGIWATIILYEDVLDPVAIVRDYVTLKDPILLENLTWDNTSDLNWIPIDTPANPYILNPNTQIEYYIPVNQNVSAILLRYTVAWASAQQAIEAHFVNEAILENINETINSSLYNFDVRNIYNGTINCFKLEIFGILSITDVIDIYNPPGDPYKYNNIWYGGWGAPPYFDLQAYGIEILWMDETRPIEPYEWFQCGVTLKSNLTLWGARAHIGINMTSKDVTAAPKFINEKIKVLHNPFFLWLLDLHKNIVPIIRYILR